MRIYETNKKLAKKYKSHSLFLFHVQHNPAQSGGTSGDAKKAFDWMDEDEDEDEEETPSW